MTRQHSAQMVDITEKDDAEREATAIGTIRLTKKTIEKIKNGQVAKGDPCTVASVAAVMTAKNTPQIIPLCHPIKITHVESSHKIDDDCITTRVKVKSLGKTGVEMEALTALTAYLLTIWDMVKSYEKNETGQYPHTKIEGIHVESKVVNR